MPVHWYSYSINVMVHQQRKNTIHKALMGKVGQRKASSDKITHRMRGLGIWCHAEETPCAMYCMANMVQTPMWLGLYPWPS